MATPTALNAVTPALIAASLISFAVFGLSSDAAAKTRRIIPQALSESSFPAPSSNRPTATFFTINAVIAKLDAGKTVGMADSVRVASVAATETASDVSTPVTEVLPATGTEPFGLLRFRLPDGPLWRKWRGVEADMAKEQTVLDACRSNSQDCPAYAAQFLRLIEAVKSKSGRAQLGEANRSVNMAIRYMSDIAQHGEIDRWSAPLATFATGKGDCEDYAIAKYVALREAGFPIEDLRILLVHVRSVGEDHALLAARLDHHWLLLNNSSHVLMDDVDTSMFTPLFVITRHGVDISAAPYAKNTLPNGTDELVPAVGRQGS